MYYTMRLLLLAVCVAARVGAWAAGAARRADGLDLYAREWTQQYEPYMFAAVPLHAPVPVLRVLSRAPLAPVPRAPAAPPAASARLPRYAEPQQYAHPQPLRQYASSDRPRHYAAPDPPHSTYADYAPQRPYESVPARHFAEPPPADYEATIYDYASPSFYQKPRRQVQYDYGVEYDNYARPGYAAQYEAPSAPAARPGYAASYDAPSGPAARPGLAVPHEGPATQAQDTPTVLYARQTASGGYTYRRAPSASTLKPKKVPAPAKEPFILKIHKYRIVKDDLL